jgi:sentrin-specific protease 7
LHLHMLCFLPCLVFVLSFKLLCRYLSTRIESTEKRRYHFFNSFFFRKLADLDKDQGRAPEGRAAFLRVRKWTRKINVFEKDFLFIPVNFK